MSHDEQPDRPQEELLCPSAGAHSDSVLIGVVSGSADAPRVLPTDQTMPVTQEVIDLAHPVAPTEVFRFAAPCGTGNCIHFRDAACQIAARSTVLLDEVVAQLPKCLIRARCRWFHQEGADMCRRCPQIVTKQYLPSAEMLRIVNETDPPAAAYAPH
ncbi:hypothetical protein ABZV29_34420 [Streptomyces sp. NPDC005236]|uniref:hypothetical protein n=1 Tax=Streptomyces sp. NPDC005236 TaxID=3157028 RepID=UPI0033B8ABDD